MPDRLEMGLSLGPNDVRCMATVVRLQLDPAALVVRDSGACPGIWRVPAMHESASRSAGGDVTLMSETCDFNLCARPAVARAKRKTLLGFVRYCERCHRIARLWGVETEPWPVTTGAIAGGS